MKRALLLVTAALFLTLGFYGGLPLLEQKPPQKLPTLHLIQTGPLKEGLKTDALAEILSLSSDKPQYLSPEKAKRALLEFPCIQDAQTLSYDAETLYIDYTLRAPQFTLGELCNAAVDKEGVFFPLAPYYTPKNLPELILGFQALPKWGDRASDKKFGIAMRLAVLLGSHIQRIDLSHLEDASWGTREIVLIVKKEKKEHLLRLPSRHYEEALEKYAQLPPIRETSIIDLRLPHLAYISHHLNIE